MTSTYPIHVSATAECVVLDVTVSLPGDGTTSQTAAGQPAAPLTGGVNISVQLSVLTHDPSTAAHPDFKAGKDV